MTTSIQPMLTLLGIKMVKPEDPESIVSNDIEVEICKQETLKMLRKHQDFGDLSQTIKESENESEGYETKYSKFVTSDKFKKLQKLTKSLNKKADRMRESFEKGEYDFSVLRDDHSPQTLNQISNRKSSRDSQGLARRRIVKRSN